MDERLVVLRPGFNGVSTWPEAKFHRAVHHAMELQSTFNQWAGSRPIVTSAEMSSDRREVFIRLVERHPPNLETWALLYGDALHNLRAALDAATWEIAHHDGRASSAEAQIQFPVKSDRRSWDNFVTSSWIAQIDPIFVERFERLQPFAAEAPADAKFNAIELLHQLDIQDKHRSRLSVAATLQGVDISSVFRREDGLSDAYFELIDPPRADGLALIVHSSGPFEFFDNGMRPSLTPVLDVGNDRIDLRHMLDIQIGVVRFALDTLYGLEPHEAEWEPLPEDRIGRQT